MKTELFNRDADADAGWFSDQGLIGSFLRGASMLAVAATLSTVIAPLAAASDANPGDAGVTVTGSRPSTEVRTETPAALSYIASIRQVLDHGKRYPTGREASLTRPEGTASVWFELSRDGKVVGHGIERSSNSMLLDQMAAALVDRAHYPSLPAGAWDDQTTHRFIATYRFVNDQADGRAVGSSDVAVR